ncbi:MAG: hypothetical protein IT428_28065 [Planctomycetaceae bacterium]|nr:hypothetical protein [Planctomycetaceae bacterium]
MLANAAARHLGVRCNRDANGAPEGATAFASFSNDSGGKSCRSAVPSSDAARFRDRGGWLEKSFPLHEMFFPQVRDCGDWTGTLRRDVLPIGITIWIYRKGSIEENEEIGTAIA